MVLTQTVSDIGLLYMGRGPFRSFLELNGKFAIYLLKLRGQLECDIADKRLVGCIKVNIIMLQNFTGGRSAEETLEFWCTYIQRAL